MRAHAEAIVVGAGPNGLAAAAALAAAGLRVLVLERASATGGQMRTLEFAPGFRVAPLALEPGWLPRAVRRLCATPAPRRVAPSVALAVADTAGRCLVLPADPTGAVAAIRRWSPSDAAAWPRLLTQLHRLAGVIEAAAVHPPPPAPGESTLRDRVVLAALGWRLRRLGRRDLTAFLRLLPMSVAELLEDHLETEALKAAIAAGAVQYGGHGPRASGTGFGLLHHLAGAPHESLRLCGWWQADPAAPAASLETAARNAGVELRTGVEVQRILVRDYRVAGVVLADGSELQSQLVLSSADPARTLLGLVDSIWLDPEFLHAVRSIRFRASAAFVLHALDGLPAFPGLDSPALAAGVSLTPSLDALERAADAMKYCQLAERPHVELVVPTLRWPHLAPPQQHILVARVPWVPPDLGSEGVERAVERALDAVSPGWSERLLHRLTLTPRDLEQQFGLTQGVATHGDLTLDQIFFMRPVPGWARYRMPIHGLVLCGAGTHPGPGVVGGAGVLAARMALHALRRAPRRP